MSKLGSKAFNTTWMESTVRIMCVKCKSLDHFWIALRLYLSIGGWLCPRVATVTDEVIRLMSGRMQDSVNKRVNTHSDCPTSPHLQLVHYNTTRRTTVCVSKPPDLDRI